MKQAVMTAPGKIMVHEIDPPKPGPGEVLLRIQRIGICGSDVHVYHGKHPYTSYPVVQGHEYSATLEAVGEGVVDLKPGMKVTSTPQIVCGQCASCQRGDYHICDRLKVEGFQAPGCAQELWVTDAQKIVILPDDFSYEQGALVEPVSVAVHAVARAGNLEGHNVVILGAGPIGNLVGQVVRAAGAQVLITDLSNHRLDIAKQCGLSATFNAIDESLAHASKRVFSSAGFDVVFECVGIEDTMTAAIANVQKGGKVIVVGVFGEKPKVDLGLVQDRELTLIGTLMYQRRDYEQAVELLASGQVAAQPLFSKHFPIDEYQTAYEFIENQGDQTMKVFIDVT